MKKVFLISAVFVLLLACSKDKFQTKPQISIKAYSTKELAIGQTMDITFTYTDKEGDLGDGKFIYYVKRQNIKPADNGAVYPDSVVNTISPDLPNIDKGDINLHFSYFDLKLSNVESDSVLIKFQVVDRAGNRSDTITSDKLVIVL